jgi:hypothetical protein
VSPGNLYYIAGSFGNPEIVKVVSDQEVFDCPDLYSTQEETDTRMILQALHADKRLKELGKQGRIIIKRRIFWLLKYSITTTVNWITNNPHI